MQEVRQALRSLRQHPVFSAAVIATIALAVGANAAIFSVVQRALLSPLPFSQPGQLVHIWKTRAGAGRSEATWPDIQHFRSRVRSLEAVAGYHGARLTLADGEAALVLPAAKVTADFFDVIGVRPVLGRTFARGEDEIGAARVAVLSHALWRRAFDGDSLLPGRAITLDGQAYTVAGVLPAGFHFAGTGSADIYVPIDRPAAWRESSSMHWIKAIARLAPGATVPAAQAELAGLFRLIERESGANRGREPLVRLVRDDFLGPVKPLLLALYGAAAFVLLIACANVTNLLLMRGASRQRELSVRLALGASRGRIARQLLLESTLLALAGGVAGFLVGQAALRGLLAAIPPEQMQLLPYLRDVAMDARVFGYTLLVSLLAGAVSGLAPALRGAGAGPGMMLRQSAGTAHGSGRLRHGLVALELALTVVLVSGAALFAASLSRLLALDSGVRPEGVLTMQVPLPRWQFQSEASQRAFYLALEQRVAALPGVSGVGFVSKLPLEAGNSTSYRVAGAPPPEPGREPSTTWRVTNAGYFSALGVPLLAGRTFLPTDDSAASAIVVNRALARAAFGDADPIGRSLILSGQPATVIGMVGDVAIDKLEDQATPTVYVHWLQDMDLSMRLAVRAGGDPMALLPAVRAVVRELDSSVGLYQIATLEDRINQSQSVFLRRYPLLLVGAFAMLALALAVVGTYGVLSYAVTQRVREMGIRLALGAPPASVRRLILAQAARVAAAGLGAGLIMAWLASRVAESLFFGVDGSRALILACVVTVLAATTLLAALLPATRAARTSPLVAMKSD